MGITSFLLDLFEGSCTCKVTGRQAKWVPTVIHSMSGGITHPIDVRRVGATSTGRKSTRSRLFNGKAALSATRARDMGTTRSEATSTRDCRVTTLEVAMVEGSDIGFGNREVGRSRR